ncbi:MAG TPA: HD domain-containing phosphohydrolase [Humisphaera sp.]|jgi:putative two-component system response regulator|nr:HD domain-containing phosphohydrolase [Humisphaera sp.]
MAVLSSHSSPANGFDDHPVVLLVDDQAIVVAAIQRQLAAEQDIEFHACTNPAAAVETAARLAPSVILQDLVMPDVDGLDLITSYRNHAATRQTPLIVLSSQEEAKTKAEAFRRGANDYLVKLPQPVELIARIRYHSRAYRLLLQAEALHEAEKQRLIHARQKDALRARNTLIFGLAKLAESRDSDTGDHLERIAAYCRVLAEQLRASIPGLTDDWIHNLQLASSLHDIGKVGIPDQVLLKAGPLTPDEREIIQRHPSIGADALGAILERDSSDELLKMARNIAASHHERWDGRGYPAGLQGEAIPLEARVVSVADVYDALTSARVYKAALPHEDAMKIIYAGRSSQFDPMVVNALLESEVVFRQAGLLLHAAKDGSSTAGSG